MITTAYNDYNVNNTEGTLTEIFERATHRVIVEFDTTEAAEKFAAQFPKFCKVKASKSYIWFDLQVKINKVTGEANETAEKRVRKTKEIIQGLEA